jgi:hypothetical protein
LQQAGAQKAVGLTGKGFAPCPHVKVGMACRLMRRLISKVSGVLGVMVWLLQASSAARGEGDSYASGVLEALLS